MKILVTGAPGLVGNAVCRFFLREGHGVTGTFMNSSAEIENECFNECKIDLTKDEISFSAMFDAVIHCSAVIPNAKYQQSDEDLYLINQKIDQKVFSYCLNSKTKLIYISTAYLYDNSVDGLLREDSLVNKELHGYYKSKYDSENFILRSELNAVILRISSPYGSIDKQNNVMRLFSEKIKNNLPITLIGKGDRRQNFIHVEDIADACSRAIKTKTCGIFNTCYSRSYTMLELAYIIKTIYKSKSEFFFNTSATEIIININFDIAKIKSALGWKPVIDLQSGLQKTLIN